MTSRIAEITTDTVDALKTTSAPGVGVCPETSAQYKIYNSIRRFEKHMYIYTYISIYTYIYIHNQLFYLRYSVLPSRITFSSLQSGHRLLLFHHRILDEEKIFFLLPREIIPNRRDSQLRNIKARVSGSKE